MIFKERLFTLASVLILVIVILAYFINDNGNWIWPLLAILLALPFLLGYLGKRKARKEGVATIDDNSVHFVLEGDQVIIRYNNIESYKITYFKGVYLTFKLKDGTKFKLSANANFCDTGSMELFCTQLEDSLDKFRNQHPEASLERKKSTFELAWFLYAISALSLTYLGVLIYSFYTEKTIPRNSFIPIIVLPGIFAAIFNARKRAKAKQ